MGASLILSQLTTREGGLGIGFISRDSLQVSDYLVTRDCIVVGRPVQHVKH